MPADINSLPNDALRSIFSFLNANQVALQLSRVSKKWNTAAKAPALWRHMLKKHFGIDMHDPNILPKKLFENVKNFAKANPLNVFMMGGDIFSVVTLWKSVRDLGASAEETFNIPTVLGIDIHRGSYNGFEITAEHNPMIVRDLARVSQQHRHYIICCPNHVDDITKAARLKTALNMRNAGQTTATQLVVVLHPGIKLELSDGLAENCIVLSKVPNKDDAQTSIELAREFYLQFTRLHMQSLYIDNVKVKLLNDSQATVEASPQPSLSVVVVEPPRTEKCTIS